MAFDAAGDVIDLRGIDANLGLAGDQAFQFGTAKGAGRLWAAEFGAQTLIRGNVDASGAWEFELAIEDGTVLASAYSAGDFIL